MALSQLSADSPVVSNSASAPTSASVDDDSSATDLPGGFVGDWLDWSQGHSLLSFLFTALLQHLSTTQTTALKCIGLYRLLQEEFLNQEPSAHHLNQAQRGCKQLLQMAHSAPHLPAHQTHCGGWSAHHHWNFNYAQHVFLLFLSVHAHYQQSAVSKRDTPANDTRTPLGTFWEPSLEDDFAKTMDVFAKVHSRF